MSDFFNKSFSGTKFNQRKFNTDPFFDHHFFSHNHDFENPFMFLHNSFQQIHQEINDIMRNTIEENFNIRNGFNNYNQINDVDLDKQVEETGLKSIFTDDNINEWDFVKQIEESNDLKMNNNKFYGKSYYYNYYSDGSGKVEKRKVVQDSRGNRLESVLKKLDDRSWAKTIKQNDKGELDENEKMVNMDEGDKENFINDWKNRINQKYLPSITSNLPPEKENIVSPVKNLDLDLDKNIEKKKLNGFFDKLKFW